MLKQSCLRPGCGDLGWIWTVGSPLSFAGYLSVEQYQRGKPVAPSPFNCCVSWSISVGLIDGWNDLHFIAQLCSLGPEVVLTALETAGCSTKKRDWRSPSLQLHLMSHTCFQPTCSGSETQNWGFSRSRGIE